MQINKHVHAIRESFLMTTPSGAVMERFVYVYLIYGTNGVNLIDAGVAAGADAIFDYIRMSDRRVEDINLIVQTHAHPDHIGATRTIKAESACGVAVHPAEKAWIEDIVLQERERPVPGFDSLVAGSVAVTRLLEDQEVFDLGCGLKLKVLHTPGHSKGSITILLLGYMVLFTGDAIPVPGQIPIYEDAAASVASIRKLRSIEGIRYLLQSWDEPAKGADAYRRMDEGLQYIQRVHDAVRTAAGTTKRPDLMDLTRHVFQLLGIPPEAAHPIAARTIAAHLKLRRQKNII